MLALIFLSGSIVLGVAYFKRLTRSLLDPLEHWLWGTVCGWLTSALAAYLIARWFGRLATAQLTVLTIAIWILAAAMIAWNRRAGVSAGTKLRWRRQYAGLLAVLLIFTPLLIFLFWTHMFRRGPGGIYSGGSAAYDLSFHAALTNSFLYADNFPPRYLFFPPATLRYPFLSDFQTAVVMIGNLSLRSAWIVTGVILSVAISGLLYFLAHRITRSQKAAVFAALIFLLNGGLGFIDAVRDWWRSSGGVVQFWRTMDINYANNPERGLQWPNLIADGFLPQRPLLFGLAISLIVFTCFAIAWAGPEKDSRDSPRHSQWTLMMFAGVLTGFLPITHTHSYIAVIIAGACLSLLRPRWFWLGFWIPAIGLAAPHVSALVQPASSQRLVYLLPGWLGHDQSFAFPVFLLRNFGLPLALAIPAWLVAPREWRKFYLAFLAVFVFAMTVVVSPNVFDNGKLAYHWHALNSIFVGGLTAKMWAGKWKPVSILFVSLSICTALLALYSETNSSVRVLNDEEVAAGDFIRQHTAARGLFLTAPSFSNPVTLLAGRSVVRGPTAWLASHGYEFREREADLRRIYAGTADALDLIRDYGIDYVYAGDHERALNLNLPFLDQHFRCIYNSGNISIYDTHAADDPHSGATTAPRIFELSSRVNCDPNALLTEFSGTSFYAYRLIRVSFGRLPRRDELLKAMADLGRGVKADETARLKTNQDELVQEWTTSLDFKAKYDNANNAEFIDTLVNNAALEWPAEKRRGLAQSLDGGQLSRAAVLSQIIEDRDLYAREYNTAYVLMHFFGYLRRNPDDPPDGDLRGLLFWRERLDRWHDYRSISRAFIDSSEYASAPLPEKCQ
ncbi:MAG TPA: hypothetical protein VE961_03640 [Pyrinomonadaceae bacterium]|nr:hypothetical protein [Pyrinomonadaceae bacterium]